MKMDFKKWYAIIVLVVFIAYGRLYLTENRYIEHQSSGAIIDTWTQKIVPMDNLLPNE